MVAPAARRDGRLRGAERAPLPRRDGRLRPQGSPAGEAAAVAQGQEGRGRRRRGEEKAGAVQKRRFLPSRLFRLEFISRLKTAST